MKFEWNEEKNDVLKAQRGVGFERVVEAFERGAYHVVTAHPNRDRYPNQFILVIEIDGYPCRVPFVWKDEDTAFLKTVYPSRKELKTWKK